MSIVAEVSPAAGSSFSDHGSNVPIRKSSFVRLPADDVTSMSVTSSWTRQYE